MLALFNMNCRICAQSPKQILCGPALQILTFKEFEQVVEARCFQILLTILWWKGLQFRHVSKNPKTFLRTGWNWKLSVQSLGIMIPTKNFGKVSQLFVISLVPTALGLICQLFCTVRREYSYLPKRMAWADLVDLPNRSHLSSFHSCWSLAKYQAIMRKLNTVQNGGVVGLVSVSDNKIQTSILIPRRGLDKGN